MLDQSADPNLDHESRMRLNARAQVYATLASSAPADERINAPIDETIREGERMAVLNAAGELIFTAAPVTERLSLKLVAVERISQLLQHFPATVGVVGFTLTYPRAIRLAGEMMQGKYGDCDRVTGMELAFYSGVLAAAVRITPSTSSTGE
ncbi:hypothetical protein CH300_20045 [Rhodococcus sp. 15-1154-1]|nr:hypothetical protein CH300_20045 [Rhodococcus sp. 15-1154-1]